VKSKSSRFRASAAWVLGRIEPTRRFARWLDSLVDDEDPAVAERAEASMKSLDLCWLPVMQ